MEHYKRKIRLDYREGYFVTYSDGTIGNFTDIKNYRRKRANNISISGITGPDQNILISFNQKIKDLGIYDDSNNIPTEAQENIIENVIDTIIGNINIGGG